MESSEVLLVVVAVATLVLVVGLLLARGRPSGPRGDLDALAATVISIANDKLAATTDAVAERVEQAGRSRDREFDLRSDAIHTEVAELRQALTQVTELVAGLQRDRAVQHRELVTRLESAAQSSHALHEVAAGLRDALANPQRRGSWGERTAADVLGHAGFVEGVSFRRQRVLAGGSRPDFTFLLPQGRELHMDVKFPVDNYLRFLESDADADRERYRKQFMVDVRARVAELSGRAYIDSETTVEYLLLFIPNESVLGFICESEPRLVDLALSQRVILCSPFTLFSVLAIVRQAVEIFQLERRTDEVLDTLRSFSEQWEKYGAALDKVDRQFRAVSNSFEELNGTRRRQLQRSVDRIAELRRLDDLAEQVAGSETLHVGGAPGAEAEHAPELVPGRPSPDPPAFAAP